MAPAQQAAVAEVVDVAPDRLRRDTELVGKRLYRLETVSPDAFDDGAGAIFRLHSRILSPFLVPIDLHGSNELCSPLFSFI
jgi:hypothetical protein